MSYTLDIHPPLEDGHRFPVSAKLWHRAPEGELPTPNDTAWIKFEFGEDYHHTLEVTLFINRLTNAQLNELLRTYLDVANELAQYIIDTSATS